jgi:membrane associated rhomboid family serine protease
MFPIKDNMPTDRFPVVTLALIIANFIVYLLTIRHGGSLISGPDTHEVLKYGAIPRALTHSGVHCAQVAPVDNPQAAEVLCNSRELAANGIPAENPLPPWQTVFTSMFMHGSILHIAGNMLFLWIFGNNVEDSMARPVYVIFYLMGGLAATLLQTAVGPNSTVPNLGASGAIAAVLGGYALLYPRARVITLVFIIFFITVLELPALLVLGSWFVLQLISAGNSTAGGGGVAYFAHIGGFLFGLATIKLLANRAQDDYNKPQIPVY